ncbi:Chromosome-associated kinesin kif4a [Halocaridina rubra]|uniref:Chromosome-associated kinesin kif4a n=1 Tax=Halocaridina rubra TaxID=373956 RepID=A0AAN9AGC1_HALRR
MFPIPQTPGNVAVSNIKVYARTRPLLQQEREQGATSIVTLIPSDKKVIVEDKAEKSFKFENVFGEKASQEELYQSAVAPLVRKVLDGQNATVLAYGQTGSGKTYTIGTDPCSTKDDEGILRRAMSSLLNGKVSEGNLPPCQEDAHISISFLEVYNEVIYDLLASSRVPLKTKVEFGGAISAVGLIEKEVTNVADGLHLIEKGCRLRSVASTALNRHSSRSHALIYLIAQNGNTRGCLILVDLAGAEGVGRAQTSGQHLTEGIHINQGLLTLGRVLSSLSNPSHTYVPYRESILTRLLKESLEGSRHTAMIACLNPANCNMHETINTLRYAEQAQNVRMKPQVLSTIKKSGIKRRCEDVTATPGAWKRRVVMSGKKEHNTTVSTPGHKPSARRALPMFNNTFATPSSRMRDITNFMPTSVQKLPPPLPPISQPVCEDDSPSRFLMISDIDDPDTQPPHFSPYIERITNRLEQSMVSHLESIEDRVADRIISRLKNRKGKSSRLVFFIDHEPYSTERCMIWPLSRQKENFIDGGIASFSCYFLQLFRNLYLCTSPSCNACNFDSSGHGFEGCHSLRKNPNKQMNSSTPDKDKNKSSSDSSLDDSFSSVANALLTGRDGKKAFAKLVTQVLKDIHNQTGQQTGVELITQQALKKEDSTLVIKEPIRDISNMPSSNLGDTKNVTSFASNTNIRNLCQNELDSCITEHPITSTAFNQKRHVRRSTRLSTMNSIRTATFKKVSPVFGKGTSSPILFTDKESPSDIQPIPKTKRSSRLSKRLASYAEDGDVDIAPHLLSGEMSFFNDTPCVFIGASPHLKARNSLKRSDLKNTGYSGENTIIFQETNNLPTGCQNHQRKIQEIEDKLSSPLQIDRVPCRRGPVRRSTRLSAIVATQRNFEILKGSSPVTSLCRAHNRTHTVSTMKGIVVILSHGFTY